jgi:hypothetical protein
MVSFKVVPEPNDARLLFFAAVAGFALWSATERRGVSKARNWRRHQLIPWLHQFSANCKSRYAQL